MKALQWFRLYGRTIDDPKLKLLAFEDRWHFIALLCLKSQGVIDNEKLMLEGLIAVQLGLSTAELDLVKKRLMKVKLIDACFNPTSWNDLQFISDSSTGRVKKYRDKQRVSDAKQPCNVSVTVQETETETETEKNKTLMPSRQVENAACPYKKIVDLYHKTLPASPKVRVLTQARKSAIKQRHIQDMDSSLEEWESYFELVDRSDFLTGKTQPANGRRVFVADLEWITKQSNFAKIFEGKYHGE